MLRRSAVAVLATLLASNASAASVDRVERLIVCQSKGQADIVLQINSEREQGRLLSCIDADFISDMTPCSADGSWSLSYPTGTAAISSIVDRWQDWADHMGGVTFFRLSADSYYFDGGFKGSEDDTYDQWSFTVDRTSGKGFLKRKPDEFTKETFEDRTFDCEQKKRKL